MAIRARSDGSKAIVWIGTTGLSCGIAPVDCDCDQVTCHGDGPDMKITVHGHGQYLGINYETHVAHESNRGDIDYGAMCSETFCTIETAPITESSSLGCANGNATTCPIAFVIYQKEKMGIDTASPALGDGPVGLPPAAMTMVKTAAATAAATVKATSAFREATKTATASKSRSES